MLNLIILDFSENNKLNYINKLLLWFNNTNIVNMFVKLTVYLLIYCSFNIITYNINYKNVFNNIKMLGKRLKLKKVSRIYDHVVIRVVQTELQFFDCVIIYCVVIYIYVPWPYIISPPLYDSYLQGDMAECSRSHRLGPRNEYYVFATFRLSSTTWIYIRFYFLRTQV